MVLVNSGFNMQQNFYTNSTPIWACAFQCSRRPKKLEAYLFAGASESTSGECRKLGSTDYTLSSMQRCVVRRLAIHGSHNSGDNHILM